MKLPANYFDFLTQLLMRKGFVQLTRLTIVSQELPATVQAEITDVVYYHKSKAVVLHVRLENQKTWRLQFIATADAKTPNPNLASFELEGSYTCANAKVWQLKQGVTFLAIDAVALILNVALNVWMQYIGSDPMQEVMLDWVPTTIFNGDTADPKHRGLLSHACSDVYWSAFGSKERKTLQKYVSHIY